MSRNDGKDLRRGVPVVVQVPTIAESVHSVTQTFPLHEPMNLIPGRLYMMGVDEKAGVGIVRDPTPEEAADFGWMEARGVLNRTTEEDA